MVKQDLVHIRAETVERDLLQVRRRYDSIFGLKFRSVYFASLGKSYAGPILL